MHTISWNLKALCSCQVTPLTHTNTHPGSSSPAQAARMKGTEHESEAHGPLGTKYKKH